MAVWRTLGLHHYYTDRDVVLWRIAGIMDEAHIEQMLASVDDVLARFHHSILLVDCSQARSLSAEARRRYAEWLKQNLYPNRASIFYSASGEMRTFLLLAQRGGQLVSGRRSAIEIVADEAAARKLADELRAAWTE